MLYTRKGDKGQTQLYHCDQRLTKSSQIAEALGALDEVNSFLGWCKVKAGEKSEVGQILGEMQEHLFSTQAELAGAPKKLSKMVATKIELIIKKIEKELPPINNFIISGGTEMSAMLDVARTMARRAERQVVAVAEIKDQKISPQTLSFLNRLSSLLYALARLANHRAGIAEAKPRYK